MGVRIVDGQPCRCFFLEPPQTFHRRYEALRAFFIEDRPVAEIAAQFGYKPAALSVMISRFRAHFRPGRVPPFSSLMVGGDHRASGAAKTGMAPMSPRSPTSGS
jgi:hypothetical protein